MKVLNKNLRKRIIQKGYEMKNGHLGSALSCVDVIKYLYDEVLQKDDLLILSKGHGSMALYSVLEGKMENVLWREHPEIDEEKGIYATTGSLGHGVPIGLGRAFGKKLKGNLGKVYILTGDGEIEEGSNWESFILANKLDVNLNLLIDWNKYQAIGELKKDLNLDGFSLEKKLTSFGFKSQILNGHNLGELKKLKNLGNGLNAVILDTIKGKGVKFLEEEHPHVYIPNEGEYYKFLNELN